MLVDDSTQAQFAVNLSKALFKLGRTSKAKDVLLACMKEHPKFVPARVNLGLLFYSEGNLTEAQRAWKKALDIDPTNQEAGRCLSMIQ